MSSTTNNTDIAFEALEFIKPLCETVDQWINLANPKTAAAAADAGIVVRTLFCTHKVN